MNRVKIKLTRGNINNHSINLSKYKDLFPNDSFGPDNESDGQGKKLILHIAGVNSIIETDIAKMVFRRRAWCREFFKL